MKEKNPIAQAFVKLRWSKKTKEERKEIMSKVTKARLDKKNIPSSDKSPA